MKEHDTDQASNLAPEPGPSSATGEQLTIKKYLPWIGIAFLLLLVHWEYNKNHAQDHMKEVLSHLAEEAQNLCVAKIDTACNDLQYIQSLIEAQIQNSGKMDKQQLESTLVSFTRHKKTYDQIRYLDAQGQEQLRMNLLPGGPTMVLDSNLQNKGHRPYFEVAMSLMPGEIYISSLDLNQEYGKIEMPHKPVLRLAVPIFDTNQKACGVVVLSLLARKLRAECRHILAPGLPKDSQICMNLLGPDRKELMPPVFVKTGKELEKPKAEQVRAYVPVSKMDIPSYEMAEMNDTDEEVAEANDARDNPSRSNEDIFTIEMCIPAGAI